MQEAGAWGKGEVQGQAFCKRMKTIWISYVLLKRKCSMKFRGANFLSENQNPLDHDTVWSYLFGDS